MAITENDWATFKKTEEYRQSQRRDHAKAGIDPRLIQQAEVHASHLTGSPEWDFYLSKLQALVEAAQGEMNTYSEALTRAFDEKSRTVAQIHYHRAQAALDTLKECMSLPKQILDGHLDMDQDSHL